MKTMRVLLVQWAFGLLAVSAAFAAPPQLDGEATLCASSNWPQQGSDLAVDPSLQFGRLANGLRYVLKKNNEPKERVAIYLTIQAGSIHEEDNQRGLAHFLEHMMFNGTAHFPPGKLVEYFQGLGMSFGGDANAHTGYDETVYKLVLPGGSPEQLREGLTVLADFARGALLHADEVERERGVILAEKRSGDSAGYRAMRARNAFVFKGTRLADRLPIGTQEVLTKSDRDDLKQFYDAWYRPENMVVVAVGDIQPSIMSALIAEVFSPLQAQGEKPVCPQFGSLQLTGRQAFYHYEADLGATEVSLESLRNQQRPQDSKALRRTELMEDLGVQIMSHRLAELQESGVMPFTAITYGSGEMLGVLKFGSISARTNPEHWVETIDILHQQLQQALDHGFAEAELVRVKKEFLASLDAQQLTENTRDSKMLAMAIGRAVNGGRVFQSPEQQKALYGSQLSGISLAEVNAAFRAVWPAEQRLVSVTGNTQLKTDQPEQLILATYQQALARPIAAPKPLARLEFPYLDVPMNPEKPTGTKQYPAIDVKRLEFANGVVVNLKQTPFAENTIQLRVDFGAGKAAELQPGLALLAERVVNDSGSGRMQNSELQAVLAGSTVRAEFRVGEESLIWEGSAVEKDLELLMQVLVAMLRDPGIKKDAYDRAMQGFAQMYERLAREISGAFPLVVQPFLAGNDRRFGLPSHAELQAVQLADLHSWLLPQFQSGGMEVAIVGDFKPEQVAGLVGRYFGSLPARGGQSGLSLAPVFPAGQQLHTTVATASDKAMLVMAWPTTDFWDIAKTRRLQILANVVEDRLREVVREKLGATYSPQVSSFGSRAAAGYGMLFVQLVVEPARVEEISSAIFAITEALQAKGVGQDELDRALAPMQTNLKETVRTNEYWLYSVLALAGRHPQQLDWPASILTDYGAITTAEISALAATYLPSKKAAKVVVLPVAAP